MALKWVKIGNLKGPQGDSGPKVISFDPATGRPYWDTVNGTHRIFGNHSGRF